MKDPFYDRIFESVIARPSLLQLLKLLVTMVRLLFVSQLETNRKEFGGDESN